MTLPLVPRGAGARRPLAGALLAVLLLLCARAPAQTPTPAPASDDPYTTTVTVDATADNVVHARDKARLDGQRKALAQIADTLAGGAGKGKLPNLGDNQITDMVVSFEVANERMTTVRYTADYTYHFRAADVQKVLQKAGVPTPAATGGGKPALVLPIYQIGATVVLWDDPNPWRDAWTARNGAADHLILPLGDVTDLGAIDAEKARGGDSDALTAIGKKYGTDDVLVAFAALRGPASSPAGLDVTVKRYRAGQLVDSHAQSVDANPGESAAAFFRRAVDATASAIDGNWQGVAAQPSGPQATLTVAVAITGLDDWIKIRDRITGLPAIRRIELRSLSRQEATIDVDYIGDADQLTAALKGLGFDLVRGDPVWHLSRSVSGAPAAPPPGPTASPMSPSLTLPQSFAPPSFAPPSFAPLPGSLSPPGPGK
jgi:hypothetical protein